MKPFRFCFPHFSIQVIYSIKTYLGSLTAINLQLFGATAISGQTAISWRWASRRFERSQFHEIGYEHYIYIFIYLMQVYICDKFYRSKIYMQSRLRDMNRWAHGGTLGRSGTFILNPFPEIADARSFKATFSWENNDGCAKRAGGFEL